MDPPTNHARVREQGRKKGVESGGMMKKVVRRKVGMLIRAGWKITFWEKGAHLRKPELTGFELAGFALGTRLDIMTLLTGSF